MNSDQTISLPALRAGLREDLYLVLAGWSRDGTTATLKVFVNPLASFLWLGGLVFLIGGAVALWPSARARGSATGDRDRCWTGDRAVGADRRWYGDVGRHSRD